MRRNGNRFTKIKTPAIIGDEYASIPLGGNNGSGIFAIVDIEDAHLADKYNFWLEDYPRTGIDGKKVRLHTLILGKQNKGFVIDHINRDKLDNRRSNLRVLTHQLNIFNSKLSKNNTTGFNGVSFDKRRNKYIANIKYNYKNMFIGYYNTSKEASVAYERKKEELLNII